ncbi:MAG: adenylyltransferase/cytidyltransferase family protein [Candidatus Latescibacterota bacterium]|nr:adenylyltransferase/cytidyltransferase family protein [Candidatus Latescibacterota bacterium]
MPPSQTADPHQKLLSRGELIRRREVWRRQGQQVVFTNGCFDLLHRGHVDCLESARRCGDILVVGLNDDDSIRQLKGPGRPLQPLDDRIAMLGALSCVCWLTVFSELSVESLVRQLLPDVLVKGGDYARADVVGADVVEEAGGRVVVSGHVEGTSTSELLKLLHNPS